MELRRQPYLLKFKKDNQNAVANKIREMQLASEQQKNHARSFLADEPPRPHPVMPPERGFEPEEPQQTKTARKKPKCSIYLSKRNENMQEEQEEDHPHNGPPLPLIVIPGNQEDKQLEYLKSEEYMKYLEKLTQAHSKEEKAKIIKENRNNNVYLGKGGMDRKQYIQEIIRTKEVLPRVNLQRFNQSPSPKNQSLTYRGQLVDSIMLNPDTKQNFKQNENKKGYKEGKKDFLQESPIKFANQDYELPITKQKQSNNVTIVLSPVCLNQQKYFKPAALIEPVRQQSFKAQKSVQKIEIFYHNQPSDNQQSIKKHKKNHTPRECHRQQEKKVKANTFRDYSKTHQEANHRTERSKSKKDFKKPQKVPSYYKTTAYNRQNYRENTPQSYSNSSSPQFSGKGKAYAKNIYDIQFKIDKPSTQKANYISSNKKKIDPNKKIEPLKVRHSPNSYCYTPDKPGIVKHSQPQPRQRQWTENYENAYPLMYSQASSTITRQDNQSTSRSARKMTVISRSKHKQRR